VPTPNPADPNDPLRWPKHKKHIAFAAVCAFTFLTNYGIGGLAPAFFILSIEFDKSMAQTSHLLLWPVLVLGAFNFFWVPLANCTYGVRLSREGIDGTLMCEYRFWETPSFRVCERIAVCELCVGCDGTVV
jgi:hypothetical protein